MHEGHSVTTTEAPVLLTKPIFRSMMDADVSG